MARPAGTTGAAGTFGAGRTAWVFVAAPNRETRHQFIEFTTGAKWALWLISAHDQEFKLMATVLAFIIIQGHGIFLLGYSISKSSVNFVPVERVLN